jgi:hypothetical protein
MAEGFVDAVPPPADMVDQIVFHAANGHFPIRGCRL